MVLSGRRSRLAYCGWFGVPADRGRELAGRIAGAQLHIINGAGHLLPEDRPAELTTTLLAFHHNATQPDPGAHTT